MPPFIYSLAFWKALAYVAAALVAYFTDYKLEAGVLLVLIQAVLQMFDIVPQIKANIMKAKFYTPTPLRPEITGTTTIHYFSFEHLPPHLKEVSKPIAELAMLMESSLPNGPEKSAGMRKLLEAKDCFVRTKVK